MSVQFIVGRAGTGKTHWCFQRMMEAERAQPLGKPVIFLTPRQATFQMQRMLACSGRGGFLRTRVLSFEDLGQEILSECGGIATGEISNQGRRMILGHLLRQLQSKLVFFRDVAQRPGVAADLDEALTELERCGAANDLLPLAETQNRIPDPSLNAKIHDLALIQAAYVKFLGNDRLDPNRRLSEALAAIARCPSLRDAEIYVDSFYEITTYQLKVLGALAQTCRQICITLTLDRPAAWLGNPHELPDEMSLFHRTETAYRRLWFAFSENQIAVDKTIVMTQRHRFVSPALASLEHWENNSSTTSTSGGAITFIEAPDDRAEVNAAARWIADRVAAGFRYRDIVVLMRDEEIYRPHIEASFLEHNIPFFIDRRRTAAHHPLLRLVRAALGVAQTKWAHEPILSLIKTKLIGLTDLQSDLLENYVLQHGIHHIMWTMPKPWTARRPAAPEPDEPDAESIDAALAQEARQKLVEHLIPFVKSVTAEQTSPIRTFAAAVFSLLEAFKVREQIVEWMRLAEEKSRFEERGEHERVWGELIALFNEIVELLGNERVELATFVQMLDAALEQFDLAIAPPTVDQVLVGPVDRTRTPAVRACVVLGLAEGRFPRAGAEGTIFNNADRRMLRRESIDLDPDTRRRLLDENFLGYLAFTRASEFLLLTRCSGDPANQKVGPSSLWIRAMGMFSGQTAEAMPREQDMKLHLAATPRQLVCILMRNVREAPDPVAQSEWRPVYDWLAAHPTNSDAIDSMRYRAWRALSYSNSATLPAGRAGKLFATPLNAGIGQIESFRSCPFRHFIKYGLNLRARRKQEIGGRELSRVYHDGLDFIAKNLIQSNRKWSDLSLVEARDILADCTKRAAQKLEAEQILTPNRSRFMLDRINRTLKWIIAAQRANASRGEFRPAWTEVRFGSAGKSADALLPPLSVQSPRGNVLHLSGMIDRVDVTADGDACAIDYRLASDRLSPAKVFQGLSLQLLISLLVLQKHSLQLSRRQLKPSGAFFVGMLRPMQAGDPLADTDIGSPAFHSKFKQRGVFDLDAAPKFDNQLTSGASDIVQLFINKDGQLGKEESSDAMPSAQLAALLHYISKRLGEITDEIVAGDVEIKPYRMGNQTACSTCEFRSVCRFEPAPGAYNDLDSMSRKELLERVNESSPSGKSK